MANTPDITPPPSSAQWAERLRWAAMALLLAVLAGRLLIGEPPYRTAPFKISEILSAQAAMLNGDQYVAPELDRMELARCVFPCLLMVAGLLTLSAGMVDRRPWRGVGFSVLAGLLAAGLIFTAIGAQDQRSAWITWGEQAGLLAAAVSAMQLCGGRDANSRRRLFWLVITLAGLCGLLGIKGLYQHVIEFPEVAAMFESDRAARLTEMGMTPDSPSERLFTERLYDFSAKGYHGLANIFANQMLLLLGATLGLFGVKWIIRKQQPTSADSKKEDIPAASLWLWAAGLIFALGLAGFIFSDSRGSFAAGILIAFLSGLGYWKRHWIYRHWRRALLVAWLGFGVIAAGVVGWGMAKHRFPDLSMTYRWFYWTGAAEITAQHPLLGVGGGNFGEAYLAVRRPEAEEQVKDPHNVIVHAFVQFGLPLGGLYLILLAWLATAGVSPRLDAPERNLSPPAALGEGGTLCAFGVLGGALLSRLFFGSFLLSNLILFLLEGVFPVVLLAGLLWLAARFARPLCELPDKAWGILRLGLALGAVAAGLQNMLSMGLWCGGSATLIWVALGAAGGGAMTTRPQTAGAKKIFWGCSIAAGLLVVLVIVQCVWNIVPVQRKLTLFQKAADALMKQDAKQAAALAGQARRADPWDPEGPAHLADFLLISARRHPADAESLKHVLDELIARPDICRRLGWLRTLAAAVHPEYSAQQLSQWLADQEVVFRAVIADPANARLRMNTARLLLEAGRPKDRARAFRQLHMASNIDEAILKLRPDSQWRLTAEELKDVQSMKESAQPVMRRR